MTGVTVVQPGDEELPATPGEHVMDLTCSVKREEDQMVFDLQGGGNSALVKVKFDQGGAEFVQALPDLIGEVLKDLNRRSQTTD